VASGVVRHGVLGRLTVETSAGAVPLTGGNERTVLAMLALYVGDGVSADRLADALWGEAT